MALLNPADVKRVQTFARANPCSQAGFVLPRHHFIDVHQGEGAGIRAALSLNK